jgi:hypothetical protein
VEALSPRVVANPAPVSAVDLINFLRLRFMSEMLVV